MLLREENKHTTNNRKIDSKEVFIQHTLFAKPWVSKKIKSLSGEAGNLGREAQIYALVCLPFMLTRCVDLDNCLHFFETVTTSIKCQEHLLQKATCWLRRLNVRKRIFQAPNTWL